MYYQKTDDKPCAYITKNKQRIKQFGQNVYLKDGSEFEIELYNPSRNTVLSKIKINGEFIAGGGIILRPGERIFLERYIDVPRKFKFETYTVDSTNETMNAIANNGDVEILFYEEEDPILQKLGTIDWNLNHIHTTITTGGYVYGTKSGDNIGNTLNTLNIDNTYRPDTDVTFNGYLNTTLNFGGNTDPNNYGSNYKQAPSSRSFAKKSKSIETGRVEQGSSSNQSFKTVSKNFNSWTVSTSVWKILPESQKPVEKSDLIQRCPKCLSKIKKSSWKFCPECGNELKQETYEDQLNKLSREELIELLKNK